MQLVIRHGANPNLVDERGEVAWGIWGSGWMFCFVSDLRVNFCKQGIVGMVDG